MRVLHHVDERRHGLQDQRVKCLVLWSIEDRTKDHDGGVTFPPVGILDVCLDEGDDERDDGVTDDGGKEADACSGGHGDVPFVVFCVFILFRQEREDDGKDFGEGDLGKVTGLDGRGFLVFCCLGGFDCQLCFLFTYGRPEFDGLECDFFFRVLHTEDGQAEECAFHVERHLVVVELHDPNETLERADLDDDVAELGSLANDLHNVVAFTLAIKVVPDEFERVVERLNGGGLDFGACFLLSCALDDGGQDLVASRSQYLGSNDFADVSDRLKGCDPEVDVFPLDEVEQVADQVLPFSVREFDGGDGGDGLCCDG